MIQSLRFLTMPSGVKRFLATESLYGLSIGMFTLILNLHLIEMGITEKQIGLITSMGILVMGIFAIPVSILAKKAGRKKLLVTGITSIAIGCSIFAFAEGFGFFFLAQFVVSIGLTLVETTEIQLLFHYSRSKREETQAYSFLFAVFTAFSGAGTLIGGFLPNWIELSEKGYQNTLITTSILFLLLACVRGGLLPAEQRRKKVTREDLNQRRETGSEPNAFLQRQGKHSSDFQQKLLLFAVFALITGGAVSCLQPYLNLFIKFRFDFSNEAVSMLLALNGLALFIGSIFSPSLIDRFGVKKTFLYIYMVNILLCFILFLNIHPYFFSTLLLVRGGVFTMLTNLVDSLSMSSFKDEERDLYAGMRAVFRSIGSALAAFLVGTILAGKNYTLPFILAGLLLLLGYAYFTYIIRPKFFEADQEFQKNTQEGITNEC
ncbi:Predicted arabinose efflux permease, MFS family [Bacillus sp. OV166]|uniref:MFS transporter n=1 Tax=Bacillus sp. OV166 TaxID=1882763 RepID=UPI000A2ADE9D|nr:MFS transporter [Bacillus sp. OV166]SMQ62277.1 Predicted arabinose efflux permease, MFS family [Bacillus sp. OV166]